MLTCFKNAFQVDEMAVARKEVLIGFRRNLAGLEQPRPIDWSNLTRRRYPPQCVGIDLIPRPLPTTNLLNNSVTSQSLQQKPNDRIDFLSSEGLPLRHIAFQRTSNEPAVAAIR